MVQTSLQGMQSPGLEVEYSLVNAIIESSRLTSEFRTSGTLVAARVAGGEIKLAATEKETGWKTLPMPQVTSPGSEES